MKKYYLLLFLGLFLVCTISIAQNRIIKQPVYETSNTESFEINKLELKDTATVLFCDVYSRPGYWVRISSKSYLKGKSGQIYKLFHSEGYELDKEVYMPQSGNVSFKLYMEPLDKNENTFDFFEGDSEGAFIVTGIKTLKSQSSDTPIRCELKGEVLNRPYSSRLVLTKEDGDERVSAIYIPIKNGKFEYILDCHNVESYTLSFYDEIINGGCRPIKFFTDTNLFSFKLFPMDEFNKNSVEGGYLNREYSKYQLTLESMLNRTEMQKKVDSLENAGKYYSEKFMDIQKQRGETEDKSIKDSIRTILSKMYDSGEAYTAEAKELERKSEELYKKFRNWETQYLKENTSIMSYSLLVNRLQYAFDYSKEDIPLYLDLYNDIYSQKYTYHPYTVKLDNLVKSYSSIKVGGTFIDFTAPDFSGNSVRLSEQINGKIALIELWASWCGPCRRNAISMIPVYEAYKNKGFTVVGIAREKELSAGINAAKKDNYPWLNLIELKDAGMIWEKYGLGNSGGSSYLIDRDGTILAIHPSAEEVKDMLDELLK